MSKIQVLVCFNPQWPDLNFAVACCDGAARASDKSGVGRLEQMRCVLF